MRYFIAMLLLAFGASLIAGQAAAAPPTAQECEACHGPNGVSKHSDIPTIAGMSAFYLDGQIQAYRKAQRPCPKTKYPDDPSKSPTDMCTTAKKLSSADAKAVVAFFAAQKFVAAKQPFDAALAAKGKSIHDGNCELCHSDGGSEAADDAGILAGQWAPYLVDQLTDYHNGKRIVPEKMKPKIDALSPADIKALAAFYASEQK